MLCCVQLVFSMLVFSPIDGLSDTMQMVVAIPLCFGSLALK